MQNAGGYQYSIILLHVRHVVRLCPDSVTSIYMDEVRTIRSSLQFYVTPVSLLCDVCYSIS